MTWLIDGNNDIDQTINFLGTTNNQPLIIRTNHSANPAASERMRVSASGNVGIGTSDPRHGRLTLEDDDVPLVLKETNQAPNAGGLWRVALDGGSLRFDANSAAGGDFSSVATPLTMNPGGNVGIGTTDPAAAYKLEVAGIVNATDYHRAGRPLIAAGRTPPGLEWQQYENDVGQFPSGVFIDVNTEEYHFSTTPVYVTALHGNSSHWATTGSSSVYNPSSTGFRVYIRWSDNSPLFVSEAESLGWHIQWIATETS
jgi:hypothetical protein